MPEANYLFSSYDLGEVLRGHEAKMHQEIQNMSADALLSASGESLADHFESEYRVSTPVLKEDAIQMDQHETNVDVSHDQSRAIFDRSRPFFIKGSQVDFYVPFEGDAQIFSCRASSFHS